MKAFKGLLFLTSVICFVSGFVILVRIPFAEERLSNLAYLGIGIITLLSGFVALKLNKKTQS